MKTIWTLSGFLGVQSDWDFLSEEPVCHVNPFSLSFDSLETFGSSLNECVEVGKDNYLIGYSIGGRLGMHALLDSEAPWKGAVFISSNPGLVDEEKRLKRMINDQLWARRFKEEKWEDVINAWNVQEVFKRDKVIPERIESNYCKEELAILLDRCSVGRQQDLRPFLASVSIPILWIVGQGDTAYSKEADSLSFSHPLSKVVKIEEGGHRLLSSHSREIGQLISTFFSQINRLQL